LASSLPFVPGPQPAQPATDAGVDAPHSLRSLTRCCNESANRRARRSSPGRWPAHGSGEARPQCALASAEIHSSLRQPCRIPLAEKARECSTVYAPAVPESSKGSVPRSRSDKEHSFPLSVDRHRQSPAAIPGNTHPRSGSGAAGIPLPTRSRVPAVSSTTQDLPKLRAPGIGQQSPRIAFAIGRGYLHARSHYRCLPCELFAPVHPPVGVRRWLQYPDYVVAT